MKPTLGVSSSPPLHTVPDTSSPAYAQRNSLTRMFDAFASFVTRWAGSPMAFGAAVCVVVVWMISGPAFHYSDGWQLVINTGTTIVTFLMVFLIQQSQNKDSVAVHLKLNELLASHKNANDRLIGIENFSEQELRRIAHAYLQLAEQARHRDGESVEASVARECETPPGEAPSERTRPIGANAEIGR
ncbi:Low affinity iron permease family protein (plasmid) [Pararobbsia alpina]|uniref:low affinity iron permease family protein n=1 Tax=Pararobbsia alpina TaxID=621374 RepID=UPI0039A52435